THPSYTVNVTHPPVYDRSLHDALPISHVMLGYNVYAADTDAQAHYLASSWQQSFVNLRSGRPGPLPAPVDGYMQSLSPQARGLRSEEHTSELQSHFDHVFRLLLENKQI